MDRRFLFGLVVVATLGAAGGAPFAATRTIDLSLCAQKPQIERRVVRALRDYARFLRGAGGSAPEADRVEGYANALAGPPSGRSQYLGFDPRAVLQEYAGALSKAGQPARAAEVRKIGQAHFDSNLACFVLQQRQHPSGR